MLDEGNAQHSEREAESGGDFQPPLFDVTSPGAYAPRISCVAALTPQSPLPVARYWFRR